MNCVADILAKEALRKPLSHTIHPGYRTMLYIDHVPITSKFAAEIRRAFHSPAIRQFLIQRLSIHPSIVDYIDWDAFHAYIKKIRIERRLSLLKMLHSWLSTLHHQNKIIKQQNRCHCGCEETVDHLFHCPLYDDMKNDFLILLEKTLKRQHTHRGLIHIILHIARFGSSKKLNMTDSVRKQYDITRAYQQQVKVGLHLIWRGILTQSFGDFQERTYRECKFPSSKTGTAWSRLVVGLFLNFFESLWEKRNSIITPKNDKKIYKRTYKEKYGRLERSIPRSQRYCNPYSKKVRNYRPIRTPK